MVNYVTWTAVLCLSISSGVVSTLGASVEKGRHIDEGKNFSLRFTVGEVSSIEGEVEETTRRLFTITGQDEKQDNAESYSFEELGFDKSETTYGLSLEYIWKYITLQLDASYFTAEVSATAPRDFFIGVDEISFGGQDFEYMVIPKGVQYDAQLEGLILGLRSLITPVTFNPGGTVQFVPWLELGFFSVVSQFEVNAGESTGVQQYENPPRDYVQGGSADGDGGAFAPEIGLGGEVKLKLGERSGLPIHLVFQGNYSIFEFEGSSDSLGVSSRNDKDLDVEYTSYGGRAFLEFPMSPSVDLIAGVEYKMVSAEADSRAKDRNLEESLARREKFDKHITLDMEIVNAILGFQW